MTRITLTLGEDEKRALSLLSTREFRDPRMQAALIIRTELERQGLIQKGALRDETDISESGNDRVKQPAS